MVGSQISTLMEMWQRVALVVLLDRTLDQRVRRAIITQAMVVGVEVRAIPQLAAPEAMVALRVVEVEAVELELRLVALGELEVAEKYAYITSTLSSQ